jgi:hypothetical protein
MNSSSGNEKRKSLHDGRLGLNVIDMNDGGAE